MKVSYQCIQYNSFSYRGDFNLYQPGKGSMCKPFPLPIWLLFFFCGFRTSKCLPSTLLLIPHIYLNMSVFSLAVAGVGVPGLYQGGLVPGQGLTLSYINLGNFYSFVSFTMQTVSHLKTTAGMSGFFCHLQGLVDVEFCLECPLGLNSIPNQVSSSFYSWVSADLFSVLFHCQ